MNYKMQPITTHRIGSRLLFAKLYIKTSANGVIFAPYLGAGKRKVDNNGSPERHSIECASTSASKIATHTASVHGTRTTSLAATRAQCCPPTSATTLQIYGAA